MLSLAVVQYVFTLGEHKVHVASHGNCRSKEPFICTMPNVMEKLKCQSDHKIPKRALHFVAKDCGGIMHATSAGSLPRSRQQVKDLRRSTKNQHDYDPLLSVILTCKETEQTTNAFVCLVNAAHIQ